jgi:hypothetical protein
MGYYEPRWNAEEQTMVDLILLNGFEFDADITKEYTRISLKKPPMTATYQFTADTEYEAIRKAFNFWNKNNAKN